MNKLDLLNKLESKKLNEINDFLPGRDYIRGCCGSIQGYYSTGFYDNIDIINKNGLKITLKIDKESFEENEVLFENTPEYDNGMEFKDWNGEWEETLDTHSSILLLNYLLKY